MIEATFSVNEDEYIDMQTAHLRRSSRRMLGIRIALICYSCAGIYASYELAKQSTAGFYFVLATIPPTLILVGVIHAMFTGARLRKQFKLAAPQISDMHIQIDNNSYRLEVPHQKSEILYWRAFTSWIESPQVIVLRRGELMYPIPKSALNEMQITELRELCSHHLVKS